jgi:POT family proton-dependent oligopeptide transporter
LATTAPSTSKTLASADAPRTVPLTAFERRFGHPPGLFVLFFTEMWERFSYYGMRTLLVLYMTKYLFLEGRPEKVLGYQMVKGTLEAIYGPLEIQPLSSQIYSLYTGFVYLTPFFGGLLADRVLGQRKTVFVGGILMAIGHFLMAFEHLFYIALLFLIFGNGAFKPNISTQVGNLYPPGDPRRDRAFSIFYVGINLGAFLQGLIVGSLAAGLGAPVTEGPNPSFDPANPGRGWHYGFAAAGVGMMLGLIVYLAGQRYLASDNVMKRKDAVADKPKAEPLTRAERASVLALCVLCALNIVFWAVYEQQGNTMQLWATDNTSWPRIFGWQIPSTWFQSFNPFMIFIFTPLLNLLWARQAKKGKEPSSVAKMAIGCLILGVSFIFMVIGTKIVGDGRGSLFWPLTCTAMLTAGELYLSPIGLSLVTKVAPARIVSMMMGMWFLSSFFGNKLSGDIGMYYTRMDKTSFFLMLTILGVAAGIAIWAFNRPLKRAIGKNV